MRTRPDPLIDPIWDALGCSCPWKRIVYEYDAVSNPSTDERFFPALATRCTDRHCIDHRYLPCRSLWRESAASRWLAGLACDIVFSAAAGLVVADMHRTAAAAKAGVGAM